MTAPLPTAAVGLGWVTQNRHIPALLRQKNAFNLIGVIDRKPGLARALADKLGLPYWAETGELGAVPWLDEARALTIGASPFSHAALAGAGLAKGLHVLTEKPFALSMNEGEAMAASAKAQHRVLGVVHNFQFGRAARALDRDLARGRLGALRRVSAFQLGNPARRLPVWYEELPLGLFTDESPHFFYLLRKLACGPMALLHAHALADGTRRTPRLVDLLYRDECGMPLSIHCAFDSSLSEWHVMVVGEKATAILDIFRDIYVRLPNDGAHRLPDVVRTSLSAVTQHIAGYVPCGLAFLRGRLDYGNDEIFARFAAAITRGDLEGPKGISPADALDVLQLQSEATQALLRNTTS